ncbi:hypothetical protein [Gynuella sp.]
MKNKIEFDFEAALKALKEGNCLTGKDGVMTPFILPRKTRRHSWQI